ncbi:MAG TPA: hypothetical protein ENH72_09620 [Pseudomonas sabulinigri]|uniref:Uncharacterized protein n=1 Tax=marine sediment metagenome TaxID=412755 RepID=A0A0F9YHU6_9ZZZZ|nr:hypothetical protein [Halopseudomonas sabulinigri]HEC51750.1 hypothetical protein [Halopseudomonas sabulinigri]
MINQFGLTIFSLLAIWLTQEKRIERRRWASVFGLISQPFWFWAAISSQQWGILLLSLLYTAVWAKGFYTHWIAKQEATNA